MKKFDSILVLAALGFGATALSSEANAATTNVRGPREPVTLATEAIKATPEDEKISADVKQRINADSALSAQAKKVAVETINNQVTLTGTVRNTKELEMIREHVRSASASATIIDNNLKVASAKK